MESSADPTERLTLGGVPVVVYVAMFGATLGGQLAGMALDAFVFGRRVLWVPAACSVVLEALAGARIAAARLHQPLSSSQCARLSAIYSLALAAVGLPLWGWTLVATASRLGGASTGELVQRAAPTLGLVLVALVAATLVRFALMLLVSTRGRAGTEARP